MLSDTYKAYLPIVHVSTRYSLSNVLDQLSHQPPNFPVFGFGITSVAEQILNM